MFEFSNFEGRAKNSALSRDLKISISVVEKYHSPLVVGESVSSTTKNFKLVISDFYDLSKGNWQEFSCKNLTTMVIKKYNENFTNW